MKFKMGDKIKIVSNVWWVDRYYTNKVGTVVEVNRSAGFPYSVSISNESETVNIPVDECEIEKVATKGQQLLFSFME